MSNIITRVKIVVPVAVLVALAWFVMFTKPGQAIRHADVEQVSDLLRSFGIFAVVVGMAAIFFQTWVPFIPFVLLAGANASVFGLGLGFAINYGMACASAAAAFLFSRYVAHRYVEEKIVKYPAMAMFNAKLEERGFYYVLIGRLIPVIPSSLINFGGGVSKIKFRPFFLATLIGKLPIVLLETLIGHDLLHFQDHKGRLFAMLAAFVMLLAVGHWIKRSWSRKTARATTAVREND